MIRKLPISNRRQLTAASRKDRPAMERALLLLEALAAVGRPASLKEIAAAQDIPQATAFRLCQRMEEQGYLVRDASSRRYSIGVRLMRLGLDIVRASGPTNTRHALMTELVDAIGETCNLTTLVGTEVLYLDRVETKWPLRLALEPGSRVPIHCTASGKLFLAMMPEQLRDRVLGSLALKPSTPHTIVDEKDLRRDLQRISKRAYSTDDEEFLQGLVAVAVPITDRKGQVFAAVACHAPVARMDLKSLIAEVPRLQPRRSSLHRRSSRRTRVLRGGLPILRRHDKQCSIKSTPTRFAPRPMPVSMHTPATSTLDLSLSRPQAGLIGLALLLGVALGACLALPPMAQKASYHAFHDGRAWLGIPNALNVLSNVPFAIIGLMGFRFLAGPSEHALPDALRPAYATLFAGLVLTGFGSAYYHWASDNHTLVWDRLPMTLAFMGLFAAVIGERINISLGRRLLVPLVALGIFSVLLWARVDDLRLYGAVQFYPVLAIPVIQWAFPARYSHGPMLLAAIGCYVVAKLLEDADGHVFALGHLISGHTLKHLAAAAGGWCVVRMLTVRRAV